MTINASSRASVVSSETKPSTAGLAGRFLPQRVAVVGQGGTAATYSTDKKQVTSAYEAGASYGFGSPLHLAVRQLLPVNGDGVGSIPVTLYPLVDDVAGVVAAGEIEPTGVQLEEAEYRVSVNNILSAPFVVLASATLASIVTAMTTAVNSVIEMPVVASDDTTRMGITAKWKGESGNDIKLAIVGSTIAGITFVITNPTGGAANPDVSGALAQVGNVWETMMLNCLNKTDTVALDAYKVFGEGRWVSTVKKPIAVVTGDVNVTVAAAVVIPEARKTDRVNVQLVSPDSKDLPFVVAARELSRIVLVAENNPPTGYNGQTADGLVPGSDATAWEYIERDEAVKKGSSTVTLENDQVVLGDIVTFYHPDGEEVPAYRYLVNIVKLQNITYNLDLIFEAPEWRAAPLVPNLASNIDPIDNENARTPAAAVGEVNGLIDYLGRRAIISNPSESKKKTTAQIDGSNPNRLDIEMYVRLSGNSRIKAITQNFSYFFGGN